MFDLKKYFDEKRDQINICLDELLSSSTNSTRIASAMKYSLMAGGKRLRPVLCLASAEAVCGNSDNIIREACALEMIHTYSLIHDDLPSMDNDDLRRGKPTCHIAFDEATAILAGDALLTLAFQILSSPETMSENNSSKHLDIVNRVSVAAGYQGMIQGQMDDIEAEGKQLSFDDLEKLHRLKTGVLIEASVCTGAVLGGAETEKVENLQSYAENIGLAFQVTDDILNVEGDPEIMGKSAGTDMERGKMTYPSLIGIDKSKKLAEKLVNNALDVISHFDHRADPLRSIAQYILHRKR